MNYVTISTGVSGVNPARSTVTCAAIRIKETYRKPRSFEYLYFSDRIVSSGLQYRKCVTADAKLYRDDTEFGIL